MLTVKRKELAVQKSFFLTNPKLDSTLTKMFFEVFGGCLFAAERYADPTIDANQGVLHRGRTVLGRHRPAFAHHPDLFLSKDIFRDFKSESSYATASIFALNISSFSFQIIHSDFRSDSQWQKRVKRKERVPNAQLLVFSRRFFTTILLVISKSSPGPLINFDSLSLLELFRFHMSEQFLLICWINFDSFFY